MVVTARVLALTLFAAAAAACGDKPPPVIFLDLGVRDAAPTDRGGPVDLGGERDADPIDAEPPDAGEPDTGVQTPTFTAVYAVISAHCNCHTTMGTAPRMPDRATAYTALVGKPSAGVCSGLSLVTAGNSANSTLYRKLNGTGCGVREPRDGAPLVAADLELIAAWIDAGAPND